MGAHTLTRTAFIHRDLRKIITLSPRPAYYGDFHLGKVRRYVHYDFTENPFLVVATATDDRPGTPDADPYNVIVTFSSYYPEQNQRLADEIGRETGISFNVNTSPRLEALFESTVEGVNGGMNTFFHKCVHNPSLLLQRWNLRRLT